MKKENRSLLFTALLTFVFCGIVALLLSFKPELLPGKGLSLKEALRVHHSESALIQSLLKSERPFTKLKNYLATRTRLFTKKEFAPQTTTFQLLSEQKLFLIIKPHFSLPEFLLLKNWYYFHRVPSAIAFTLFSKNMSYHHLSEYLLMKADIYHKLATIERESSHYNDELKTLETGIQKFPDDTRFKTREVKLLLEFSRFKALMKLKKRADYQKIFDDNILFTLYKKNHQFHKMALPLYRSQYRNLSWPSIVGSITTALAWALFLFFLIPGGESPRSFIPLFAGALLLGILSAQATLFTVVVQDELLGWSGNSSNSLFNFIYYVAGVGLREELWKFFAFLVLFFSAGKMKPPVALLAASFVGLGFAAEENVLYFSQRSEYLGRFLTANFFHISLTGLLGHQWALYWKRRESNQTDSDSFFSFFTTIVLLHGLYDFFIVDPKFSEFGWLTFTIFIYLSQHYLRQVLSSGLTKISRVKHSFVFCISLVSGVGFIGLSLSFGPMLALASIPLGLLNNFLIIYMFFYEFG